jgi:hypothetical protein
MHHNHNGVNVERKDARHELMTREGETESVPC